MKPDKNAKEPRDSVQIAFDFSGDRPTCDHGIPVQIFLLSLVYFEL